MRLKFVARLVLIFGVAGASGCQGIPDLSVAGPGETACSGTDAQILVGDGFLQALCGCAESSAAIFPAGGDPLTCTVPVGTTVLFLYTGALTTHQIFPASPGLFTPGPPAIPLNLDDANNYIVFPVSLTAPGDYGFFDAYVPGVSGVLIAR
jgi:hypothetical protein